MKIYAYNYFLKFPLSLLFNSTESYPRRWFRTIFEALRTPCILSDECYNLISGARKIRFFYRCACTRSAGGRVICAVRHYIIQYTFYSRPAAYHCKRDDSFRENNARDIMFVLCTVISRGKHVE